MYSEVVPDSKIVLERNPHWYGRKPPFDKVTFVSIPDPQTRLLAIRSGEITGTFFPSFANLSAWQNAPGVDSRVWPNNGFVGITLDIAQKPFDDIHVRKAIAYSMDRVGLIKATYAGYGQPIPTLNPPGAYAGTLSKAEVNRAYRATPQYSYSLAKAKQEIAMSSVPKGFSITMTTPGPEAPFLENMDLSLKQELAKIGIKVTLKPNPTGWFNIVLAHKPNLGIQNMSSPPDLPTPVSFLYQWLHSSQAKQGGQNSSNYRSEAADAAIDRALKATDPRVAARAALQAQQIAAKDVAVITAHTQTWDCVVRKPLTCAHLGQFYNFGSWIYDIAGR
jgi:peptide/nickel transport system substrate-binding protein